MERMWGLTWLVLVISGPLADCLPRQGVVTKGTTLIPGFKAVTGTRKDTANEPLFWYMLRTAWTGSFKILRLALYLFGGEYFKGKLELMAPLIYMFNRRFYFWFGPALQS